MAGAFVGGFALRRDRQGRAGFARPPHHRSQSGEAQGDLSEVLTLDDPEADALDVATLLSPACVESGLAEI